MLVSDDELPPSQLNNFFLAVAARSRVAFLCEAKLCFSFLLFHAVAVDGSFGY